MEEAIVSFVVEKVGELLIEEAKFLYGVRGKVENLQRELNRMRCFLKDADAKREEGDERVSNWVAEIRESTYDAGDVIETFIVEVALRRGRRGGGGVRNFLNRYACIFKKSSVLRKLGSQIGAINTTISNLTTSLQTYGVTFEREGEGPSTGRQRVRPRVTYPHVIDEYVVGLEENINKVMEHLVDKEKQPCQVVSLWGMGGLGKTTLAKKVYHHDKVRRHFDCLAWTYISQKFQEINVLEEILIGLLTSPTNEEREEIKKMTDQELKGKLHKVQSEKKCLVVLDDIWRTMDWDALSAAFPSTAEGVGIGSKILLTTRNKHLASHVDQKGHPCFPHELRLLNDNESQELFEKKAFPQRNTKQPEFGMEKLKLQKEMLNHCKGLPLAIVMLGGLLATKNTLDEWKMVKQNLSFHLGRGQDDGGVLGMLALSYQDLPYHLKACFLHLGHFPEDYVINITKLVQMWVAEGFVSRTEVDDSEDRLVDVARRYLGELVGRCIVQVVQLTKLSGRVKCCQLHDLMRDFCLSKAKEDNFLKLVPFGRGRDSSTTLSSTSTKIRRLSIHWDRSEHVHRWDVPPGRYHVRSILLFSKESIDEADLQQMKLLSKDFKLLRVLNLEELFLEKLPEAIGNLKHLKYLSLGNNRSPLVLSSSLALPSSVGNLRCLQTLDLRLCHNLEIPNVLWKMEQLRDLYLPFYYNFNSEHKLRLDGLSNLEVLKNFGSKCCDIKSLPKLANLVELKECWAKVEELGVILTSARINGSGSSNSLRYSSFTIWGDIGTEEEQYLLRQLLGCHHLHKLMLDGFLGKLPEHHQFSSNLTYLCLIESRLEEDPMSTLAKLPNLRSLVFGEKSFLGKELVCNGGFPQLKYIYLWNLELLEEWRVDGGALPNLFCLRISKCPELKRIPDGLNFITSLRELKIARMPEAFENRLREGGEDFHKVKHVSSISISPF